jgi:hypothetical protein
MEPETNALDPIFHAAGMTLRCFGSHSLREPGHALVLAWFF